MEKSVIIVAGGTGSRMKSDIPKQFLLLNGRPLLMHTISRFLQYDNVLRIVLVLPEARVSYWTELCREYNFSPGCTIVTGGETRFHSVRNGLAAVPDKGIVAVHDGARPLINAALIEKLFREALEKGSAVPCIPPSESVRLIGTEGSEILDRSSVRLIQTPQCFEASVLKRAYAEEYRESFTDDASVVESIGVDIHLTEGEPGNIKITSSFDLSMAEKLLQ
jgi:2-C-methyl-D-erythritol 4-phosphate cytidylyltransferase